MPSQIIGGRGQPGDGGQASLLAVFSVARDLKQRPGCRFSCPAIFKGDDGAVYQALNRPPAHTCWISRAGGLRLEPAGDGTKVVQHSYLSLHRSACTDLTVVLETAGWLQPQLVTWGCPSEQSVSQTRVGGYATATSLLRAPRAIEQQSNRFLLSYVCAFSQRFAQLLRVGWR